MSRVRSLIARALSPSDWSVARQTGWLGAMTAVQLLGGLLQVATTTRVLGAEGYGVLAVIIALTSLIYGLLAMPGSDIVTTFVTRGLAEGRPEEASRILRFALAVSLGLSLVSYALIATLTFAASSLLGIDKTYVDAVLLYGVVGILLATQTEALAVLRLSDRVSLGLVVTIASTLTRVALLASVWLTEGGLLGVILAHVAGAAVSGVGMFVVAAASARQAGMPGFLRSLSFKIPPDALKFQVGTFGKTAIGALGRHMDFILVVQLAGAADVGLYRAARQIMDMTIHPFNLMRAGVQPQYSRQWYSRQGAALRRTALRFTLLSLSLAAVGLGLLTVLREPITRLILGAEFSDTAPLLLIMIPGSFVAASNSVLSVLPVATGRVWPSLLATTASFAALVAAIVWLVPLYGAKGAAWANTIYFMVGFLVFVPFTISIIRRSYRI